MCILQKCLSPIPSLTNQDTFSLLLTGTFPFYWVYLGTQKPCLPHHQLSLLKQYGRLALPGIWEYYQMTHLGRFINCHCHHSSKLWAQLEQVQMDIPLNGALWCYNHLPPALTSHPLLGTTLRICSWVCMQTSLSTRGSPLFPILGNPQISPGLRPHMFRILHQSGHDQAANF